MISFVLFLRNYDWIKTNFQHRIVLFSFCKTFTPLVCLHTKTQLVKLDFSYSERVHYKYNKSCSQKDGNDTGSQRTISLIIIIIDLILIYLPLSCLSFPQIRECNCEAKSMKWKTTNIPQSHLHHKPIPLLNISITCDILDMSN